MPAPPTSSPKLFIQSAPVLHVPDVMASAVFYRDMLGFTWDFGDKDYAVVWRENAAIHFCRGNNTPSDIHLFLWVKDVDAYYAELKARGVNVAMEPKDQPYGIREFGVRDSNGVGILFGQDLEPSG